MPADIAPSPMTAIALPGRPVSLFAIAKPSAAEMLVLLCAAPNGSYSDSERLVKPVFLADRAQARASAGQDLVGVGLVADVPDQLVLGRVEHIVQRSGKLDHTEACAEMATGDADRGDQFGAQFVRELSELTVIEAPQIGGERDCIEERRIGRHGGSRALH